MIEWLSSWIKQIILLVLIATFLDLLLPNNAMDRYVKLVMGLLIIMAILSPTLQLIHGNLDLSSLALSDEFQNRKQMDSMEQIKEKSSEMKKDQEAFMQQQIEKSMKETVEKQIIQQFPVEVIQTNIQLHNDGEKQNQIKKIQLITRVRFSSAPQDSKQLPYMQPIQPVIISGGSIQLENAKTTSNSKRLELTRRITQYLQQTWHLLPEQINVRVDA